MGFGRLQMEVSKPSQLTTCKKNIYVIEIIKKIPNVDDILTVGHRHELYQKYITCEVNILRKIPRVDSVHTQKSDINLSSDYTVNQKYMYRNRCW